MVGSLSASATRARLAGYDAPDEATEDWNYLPLPDEMCSSNGTSVIEFSDPEGRVMLGFAPLPYGDMAEELDGLFSRMGTSSPVSRVCALLSLSRC